MKTTRAFKWLLIGILVFETVQTIRADLSSTTNAPQKAQEYDPLKKPMLDAKAQAMIDAWPKGRATNGIYCALQIGRGFTDNRPFFNCHVNVVNTSTNYYRSYLNLPREAYIQIELFDAATNRIAKTKAEEAFQIWGTNQMEKWIEDQMRARSHEKFFWLWGKDWRQINGFSIPGVFQLKNPGEYTLHLRMELVQAQWNSSGKLDHLQTTWLPEVIAPIHITEEDIPKPTEPSGSPTNAPAIKNQ